MAFGNSHDLRSEEGDADPDEVQDEVQDEVGELPVLSASRRAALATGHVVLAVDESASMKVQDVAGDGGPTACLSRLEAAALCAERFICAHARKHPCDVFSIITFSEEAVVGGEMLDGPKAVACLQQAVGRAVRGTHFSAAITAAAGLLRKRPGQLILISDGRPGDAKPTLTALQRDLMPLRAKLHGVGLGDSDFSALQQAANITGGSFVVASRSIRGLSSALTTVGQSMGRVAQRMAAATEFEEPGSRLGKRSVRFDAVRVDYSYDGLDFQCTRHPKVAVCRREKPFNRGAMRLVYGFSDPSFKGVDMVIKRSLGEARVGKSLSEAAVRCTAVARYFAARFNQHLQEARQGEKSSKRSLGKSNLYFTRCHLYEDGDERLAGEPRLSGGVFYKFNSNNGYVAEDVPHSELAQAFSHFTYRASGEAMLVVDLQGVCRGDDLLLTDPQVHSRSQGKFGPGDFAQSGVHSWSATHRCGAFCRALGLAPRTTQRPSLRPRGRVVSSVGSWERVSDRWDKVSEYDLSDFAVSEKLQSSQNSASSWALLDA